MENCTRTYPLPSIWYIEQFLIYYSQGGLMGFLERTVWRLLSSPPRGDPFREKSPKLSTTASQLPISKYSLHSGTSSSSSSASSASSSSTFWMSPKRTSRWSPSRYIPSSIRSSVSKRQIAVVLCLALAVLVWVMPPPGSWRGHVIHITVAQPASSPYQVLLPISPTTKKNAPDPLRWLEQNSNNKHADLGHYRFSNFESPFVATVTKPRAALISLARNSELVGIMQSMRQLEYQWNRKYNYPWIFFNDEPFTEEFKVWLEYLQPFRNPEAYSR